MLKVNDVFKKTCRKILFLSILVSIVLIPNSQASSNSASLYTETDGLGDKHPRLFFSQKELPSLRKQAHTSHHEIWSPIKQFTDLKLNTAPLASAPKGGLSTYRNLANQLIPYAFASIIVNKEEYVEHAKSYLLTYATWKQWGEKNYRDLGLAHMLIANALAYDWLYIHLTPDERELVRTSLGSWAEKMYEASSGLRNLKWGNWWRRSYMQNHFMTNNSALGIAGLVLLGEDDRAQKWIDYAVEQMSKVQFLLNGIADGSWHESIHYQNYGLTLSLPFLKNLKTVLNIDILPDTYFQNYTEWRVFNYLPNTTQTIFAHGNFEWSRGSGYAPQNILRFIANEYNDGHAEWMAQQLISAGGRYANVWRAPWYVFEFLYYNPNISAMAPTDLRKSKTFPDFTGVIWRTGWRKDDLVFAFKTGAYGGRFAFNRFIEGIYPWEQLDRNDGSQLNIGHNHDDTNSFTIYKSGNWLVPESEGVGKTAARFHNTILIDGHGQYRPPKGWRDPVAFSGSDGFIVAQANTTNFDFISADATARYRHIDGIERVNRQILFARPDYFILFDNIEANGLHSYDWVTHFGGRIDIDGNWIGGNAGNEQIMGIGILLPDKFKIISGDDGKPFVRISARFPVSNSNFLTVLYPTTKSRWGLKPRISIIDENDSAVFIQLKFKAGDNLMDHVILSKDSSSVKTIGNYKYNSRLAFIRRDQTGRLEKLFFYHGRYLKDLSFNTELVKKSDENVITEVDYIEKTVYIYGDIKEQIVLYGPDIEKVVIDNVPKPFLKSADYVTINGNKEPLSSHPPQPTS